MGKSMITQNINYKSKSDLVLGEVKTNSVKPTASTAYKRGDLLKVDENNVATHGTASDWNVVCLDDVTSEQADKALAGKFEIPVYAQGELNVLAVTLNGEPLNEEQQNQARAVKTAIVLRLPR